MAEGVAAEFLDTSPTAAWLSKLRLSPTHLFSVCSQLFAMGQPVHGWNLLEVIARCWVREEYGKRKNENRKSSDRLIKHGPRRAKVFMGTINTLQNQDTAKFRTQGCQEHSPPYAFSN